MAEPLIKLPGNVAPGPLAYALERAVSAEQQLAAARKAKSDAERIQHLESAILELTASQQSLITRLTGMDD